MNIPDLIASVYMEKMCQSKSIMQVMSGIMCQDTLCNTVQQLECSVIFEFR